MIAFFGILLVLLLIGVLGYWLFVVGEGTYLGPWAVRLVYQCGARVYDQVRGFPAPHDQQQLLPLLREALADHPRPRVLDVATGTGRVPLLIATADLAYDLIVGVDLTPAMLAQARAKHLALVPQAPLRWETAEATRLPFPAADFHLVTCLEALEFFPDPKAALREMVRVLRPGAWLITSKYPDAWARTLPARGMTVAAITAHLQDCGLERVQIFPWQPGHYELVVGYKPSQHSRS